MRFAALLVASLLLAGVAAPTVTAGPATASVDASDAPESVCRFLLDPIVCMQMYAFWYTWCADTIINDQRCADVFGLIF